MMEVPYLQDQAQSVLRQYFYKILLLPRIRFPEKTGLAVNAITLSPNASFAAARRKVESTPPEKATATDSSPFK